MESNRDVVFWENSYPSMYENVTEETFVFFEFKKYFKNRQNFSTLKPLFTHLLRILLKPLTISVKKDLITAEAVLPLKCLEGHENLRFASQVKNWVLHFLYRPGTHIRVYCSLQL